MNEKISIIVPAYNVKTYIQKTVESICNQTYRNLEIILVNDGSVDGTLDVLRELEQTDQRILVIDKINEGVTKARLTGAAAASGEWIGFVDGDDEIEPDMYERLLQNAIQYQADISHCGYQMVFPSRVAYYYNTGHLVEQDKMTGVKDLLSGSFIEPGLWNKIFHKTLFHSLLHDELMDLSIKNNEDLLMNYYLFRQSQKSIYEDFCPYHYIARENSSTHKALNAHQLLDPIKVMQILLRETENTPDVRSVVESRQTAQLIRLATMSEKENPELIRPNKRMARQELRRRLGKIWKEKNITKKLKIMACWAAIWPASYGLIHSIYTVATGMDKKYKIA